MNIYLKHLTSIHALSSLIKDIDIDFKDLKQPIKEIAEEYYNTYEGKLPKVKIDLPILNSLLQEDIQLKSHKLTTLIEIINTYISNYNNEIAIVEATALSNIYALISNDILLNSILIENKYKERIIDIANRYIENKDNDEMTENLLKIYFHDKLETDNAIKDEIIEFLKRYRYRESIFKLMLHYFYQEDIGRVVNDYQFNYHLYRSKVYRYYYEFYIRSNTPKLSIALSILNYSDIVDDYSEEQCTELYNKLCNTCLNDIDDTVIADNDGIDNKQDSNCNKRDNSGNTECDDKLTINGYPINRYTDITLRLYHRKPFEHILDDINSFTKNVTIYASSIRYPDCKFKHTDKINDIKTDLNYIDDYIRDDLGKVVERKNIYKLFLRWQRYLDVYDLKKLDKTWGMIIKTMQNKTKYTSAPKTAADARSDFNEAKLLINSAAKHVFPY